MGLGFEDGESGRFYERLKDGLYACGLGERLMLLIALRQEILMCGP